MGLLWIAGNAGSGKTTILQELSRSGYNTVDADDYCHWVDRVTRLALPHVPASERPADWAETIAWEIDTPRFRKRVQESNRTVSAGSVENESEVWGLFKRHVFLDVDDDTLRHRLTTRTNNDFGKGPGQIEAALSWNRGLRQRYEGFGAIIIDACQPVDHVLLQIMVVLNTPE